MGLKRKASISSSSSASTTSSLSLSPYSTAQTQWFRPSDPYAADIPQYLNSRTRKRFRDSRPEEGEIHQYTLQKLFAAQRNNPHLSLDGDGSMQVNGFGQTGKTPDIPESPRFGLDGAVPESTEMTSPSSRGRARYQRSLESFFGSPTQRAMNRNAQSSPPNTLRVATPPSALSPDIQVSNRLPLGALTCESCTMPVSTPYSGSGIDTDMMDVDLETGIGDEWECARCLKRVCDTCAIRGNERVCLECANPGHGEMGGVELTRGKSWVGGIGWI